MGDKRCCQNCGKTFYTNKAERTKCSRCEISGLKTPEVERIIDEYNEPLVTDIIYQNS